MTDEDARARLASNLTLRLQQFGWTQGDLARAIQAEGETLVSCRMRVSRWCGGHHLPPVDKLATVAELLNCTLDDLMHKPRKRRSAS